MRAHALLALLLVAASPVAAERIGTTAAVNPAATGTPPGGETRVLHVGSDVVFEERIVTSPTGQTQLLFLDQSSLTVGPNADVVLDRFVYDPSTSTGELAVSITKGVFRFVGGKISANSGATIRTPTATLGIRGSIVIGAVTNPTDVVFLAGNEFTVSNEGGRIRYDRRGTGRWIRAASASERPQDLGRASRDLLQSFLSSLATTGTGGAPEQPTETQSQQALGDADTADPGGRDREMRAPRPTVETPPEVTEVVERSEPGEQRDPTGGTVTAAFDLVGFDSPEVDSARFTFGGTDPSRSRFVDLQDFGAQHPVAATRDRSLLNGEPGQALPDAPDGFRSEFHTWSGATSGPDGTQTDGLPRYRFAAIGPEPTVEIRIGGDGPQSESAAPTQTIDTEGTVLHGYATALGVSLPSGTSPLDSLPADPALDPSVVCRCEFLSWGFWNAEIQRPDHNGEEGGLERVVHGTWVAGVLPSLGEMPMHGRARYDGHAIGTVSEGGGQRVASGVFEALYDFGQRSGDVELRQFDGRDYTGSVFAANRRDFSGGISTSMNGSIAGSFVGSFVKNGADPAGGMIGDIILEGVTPAGNYRGVATVAAKGTPLQTE